MISSRNVYWMRVACIITGFIGVSMCAVLQLRMSTFQILVNISDVNNVWSRFYDCMKNRTSDWCRLYLNKDKKDEKNLEFTAYEMYAHHTRDPIRETKLNNTLTFQCAFLVTMKSPYYEVECSRIETKACLLRNRCGDGVFEILWKNSGEYLNSSSLSYCKCNATRFVYNYIPTAPAGGSKYVTSTVSQSLWHHNFTVVNRNASLYSADSSNSNHLLYTTAIIVAAVFSNCVFFIAVVVYCVRRHITSRQVTAQNAINVTTNSITPSNINIISFNTRDICRRSANDTYPCHLFTINYENMRTLETGWTTLSDDVESSRYQDKTKFAGDGNRVRIAFNDYDYLILQNTHSSAVCTTNANTSGLRNVDVAEGTIVMITYAGDYIIKFDNSMK
ncbi:hypothetical protein BgiMline_026722 [Biomphalaria glabrata]|nr:hypothetical protein BgiMline_021176 [Biomphalaria glabrata]